MIVSGWSRSLSSLAAAVVLTVPNAAPADEAADKRAKIDALARPYIESGTATGIAVGVIRGDQTWVLSYGEVARGGAKPDGDTLFEIGSVSKVFTGLLLADLIEHGVVKLDDVVQNLLPKDVTVPQKGERAITLRDLVTHTSALPRMPANFKPKDPKDPYADYTPELAYAFLSGH